MNPRNTRLGLAATAAAFIALAMLFAPRLGIEADEALIANGIYDHGSPWYSWKFGESEVPVMLISYLGALKAWLYNGIFLLTPPRPVSLRLPMILVSAVSLWLFFALVRRTVGERAAWIATLLLATDTSYLLLSVPDFGPIAFHFLFKLAALVLLVRFHHSGSRAALAGAFFLFGLALWDKAVFLWVLFGLVVAAFAVFPRAVLRRLTPANLAIAAGALAAGALPLLVYNIARPLETLRGNARLEQAAVLAKSELLARTLDGGVFYGFMTAADPGTRPGEARRWFQSASMAVSRATPLSRRSLIIWAVLLSAAALALFWRTQWGRAARGPMLFGLVVCAATWLPMALTASAGATAHHVILLWPFHFLAIAAALQAIPSRPAMAAAALLCTSNLAVTNQYYADLVRNGPAIRWSDAMDPLNRYLLDLKAPRVVVADWGIIETLSLLNEGGMEVANPDLSSAESIRGLLASPGNVYVAHTREFAFHPNERAGIEEAARSEGYQQEPLTTISDRNGRPTFDVFRFRKVHL